MPGQGRKCIVKMAEQDTLRTDSAQHITGAGRKVIVSLPGQNQNVDALRIDFIRVQRQAAQKQNLFLREGMFRA